MEKYFFYGMAALAIFVTVILLTTHEAKGAELFDINAGLDSFATFESGFALEPDIRVYEFTPRTASGMQCIFAVGSYGGSTFCWPKVMNTEVQKWIERHRNQEPPR
jgi:hypothetical protein